MSEEGVALVGAGAALVGALLGAGATAWLDDWRARRDSRQRALTLVRAVRRDIAVLREATTENLETLTTEQGLLQQGRHSDYPVRPLSLPALDVLLSQQPRDVPADVLVAATSLAQRLARATDLQRSREAWTITGTVITSFLERLGTFDELLVEETRAIATAAASLDEQLEPLAEQLAQPTQFVQYYRDASKLDPY